MKSFKYLALALACLPLSAIAAPLDAQHGFLASLAGTWSVEQTLWINDAPKVDHGAADFAMVLNQRHLRQNLRIDDGTGFEGLGYIGYDNGRFFTTWMDVNFPGMVLAYGDCDAKACVFTGKMGEIPVREVLTISDANHFRYEFYET
ncbi:MAG: DUF1579 family protein, partial [Asticcacaulis sp.]|nr:DUF1579 family protein [Asticcacaulis sp.]